MKEYLYDAFISYRHSPFDKAVAIKLQKLLETYKPVGNIEYKNTNKIKRVFRDETELPTSGDLGADIKKALEQSAFLIVICSEDTAKSPWCIQEINYFKEIHGGNSDRILTLLINGDPAAVFPAELRFENKTINTQDGIATVKVEIEPLAANISCESQKSALKKLNTEFLRIAAPILGCGYDDLYRRHYRRALNRRIALSSIAVASIIAISGFGFFTVSTINTQKSLALQEKNLRLLNNAENLIEDGNKVLATKLVLDAIQNTKNPSEYFINETERLLSQSTYIPRFTEYAALTHDDGINDSMFTSDGKYLFTAAADGKVTMWEAQIGQRIKQFQNEDEALKLCIIGNSLYVITKSREIVIWSIDTGEIIERFSFNNNPSDSLSDYTVSDVMLYDNTLYIMEKWEDYVVIAVNLDTKESKYLNGSTNGIVDGMRQGYYRCFFDKKAGAIITVDTADELVCSIKYILSGKTDGFSLPAGAASILSDCIYDKKNQGIILIMEGNEAGDIEIAGVSFSKNLLYSASISYDEYNPENVMYLQYLQSSDLSDDSKLLALGDHYGNIMVINLENGKLINHMQSQEYKIGSLKFLDSEHIFVSHYQFDSSSFIWRFTNTSELTYNLPNTNDSQYYCCVSPDKSAAVITNKLGNAYLLSLQNSILEKDITLDKVKYDVLFNSEYEAEKSEGEYAVCAVSEDGRYKLVAKFSDKKPDFLVNQGNGDYMIYTIVDISTKQELFNAKIPTDFTGIDIKDTEKGTLLTPNGYIYEFNLKSGEIYKRIKIDYRADILSDLGTAHLYIDYENERAFISDIYHGFINGATQKCIVISTKTYQTLFDFSDVFLFDFVAYDNTGKKAYRDLAGYEAIYNEERDVNISRPVLEISIPTYSELLEIAKNQVKGREILPFEQELFGMH